MTKMTGPVSNSLIFNKDCSRIGRVNAVDLNPLVLGLGAENKALSISPHPTFSRRRRLLDLCRYLYPWEKEFILKSTVLIGPVSFTTATPTFTAQCVELRKDVT